MSGLSEAGGDAVGEVDDVERLDVEIGGAGVESGEFEQVDHHAVEAAHLADDDVERLLRSFRDVLAAGVEHFDRGGQRGDR